MQSSHDNCIVHTWGSGWIPIMFFFFLLALNFCLQRVASTDGFSLMFSLKYGGTSPSLGQLADISALYLSSSLTSLLLWHSDKESGSVLSAPISQWYDSLIMGWAGSAVCVHSTDRDVWESLSTFTTNDFDFYSETYLFLYANFTESHKSSKENTHRHTSVVRTCPAPKSSLSVQHRAGMNW